MSAFLGQHADPKTRGCEWCGEPSFKAFELPGPRKSARSAKFVYACGRHLDIAKQSVGIKEDE